MLLGRLQPGAAAEDHQTCCTHDMDGERPLDEVTGRQGLGGITNSAQCWVKMGTT